LPLKNWTIWALVASALFFLYLFGLDRTGLLSADEPRYAAIGREMAESGDWVTPRLYGQPWFEKPPLLYWMTAAGFKAGLNEDLAPRLPVAIVSVAFLIFYFFHLRSEFGERAAAFSTCILATSAGWLAYSHIAVTDLPMSAAFSAAMLLVARNRGQSILVPVFLGIAVLGKGLAPLALFLPAVWFLRRQPKVIAIALGGAILIALPWYAAVTVLHGRAFLDEFFWKHHFLRFATGALQHVRPFWFFLPVLLAGMFPWTPVLALLFRRDLYRDSRIRFLGAWFAFGFVLFSASQNKLPGYILPLLPAVAALCGIALAQTRRATWVLAACAGLLWLVPAIEQVLPRALIAGLSHASVRLPFEALVPVLVLAALCWLLEYYGHRNLAVGAIVACITVAVITVTTITYPMLDHTVSARAFYHSQVESMVCTPSSNRSWRYGLDYYAHRPIPDCK
jgi:4-amino-4-deoxy-L-arabinose transferase-like glycosyltransferase